MKLSCHTIQDMLPLVADDLASGDTVKLVNDHIKDCEECKQEYEEMKEVENRFKNKEKIEVIPLKNMRRKLIVRNIYFIVVTALMVSLISLIGVDKATKPIPLTYNEAIKSVKVVDDKVFINFTPEVSNYEIDSSGDIMSWKTIISKLDKNKEPKNTVINVEGKNTSIHYIDQTGGLDKQIYGPNDVSNYSGQLTLPRLAMNYYVTFMLLICLALLILSTIFRKKDKIKKTINTILMIPLSYIVSHILILGIKGATHHIIRDLSFVIIATILIFSIIISIRYKDHFINYK